jgi:hypothetical protein
MCVFAVPTRAAPWASGRLTACALTPTTCRYLIAAPARLALAAFEIWIVPIQIPAYRALISDAYYRPSANVDDL